MAQGQGLNNARFPGNQSPAQTDCAFEDGSQVGGRKMISRHHHHGSKPGAPYTVPTNPMPTTTSAAGFDFSNRPSCALNAGSPAEMQTQNSLPQPPIQPQPQSGSIQTGGLQTFDYGSGPNPPSCAKAEQGLSFYDSNQNMLRMDSSPANMEFGGQGSEFGGQAGSGTYPNPPPHPGQGSAGYNMQMRGQQQGEIMMQQGKIYAVNCRELDSPT